MPDSNSENDNDDEWHSEITAKLEDVHREVDDTHEDVTTVGDDIGGVHEDVAGVRESIGGVSEAIQDVKDDLRDMPAPGDGDDGLDDEYIEETLAALGDTIESVDGRVETLEEHFDDVHNRLRVVEEVLDDGGNGGGGRPRGYGRDYGNHTYGNGDNDNGEARDGNGNGDDSRRGEATVGRAETPVVEDFEAGLERWTGAAQFDTGHIGLTDDALTAGPALRIDHPGGASTDSYHFGLPQDVERSRRGFAYRCFLRFDKIDERNQAGLAVCGAWDGGGIAAGYLARLAADGEFQVLKWVGGELVAESGGPEISVSAGVRYRIEVALDWGVTIARVYDESDEQLATVTWDDEPGDRLDAGGIGIGGRMGNGSDGESVTFDWVTRESLY